MFTEYDMEKHMKVVRRDGYDEGFDDCLSEIITLLDMSKKGKTPEEISNVTGIDIDMVNKILEQSK
ncbi:MAG: hypothetical protein ACI4D4_04135 [Lachnospira sp.]